jgi:hypothetical protein
MKALSDDSLQSKQHSTLFFHSAVTEWKGSQLSTPSIVHHHLNQRSILTALKVTKLEM